MIFLLPKLTRWKLLHKIQNDRETSRIPVIAFIDPENIYEQAEYFNTNIGRLKKASNNHPNDVLSLIRNRLRLSENRQIMEKLIVEESKSASSYVGESGIKISSELSPRPKVLIIDDDDDTLFTVGEIVNDLGFETEFAHNGIEGLEVMESYNPDVILLDIMMPQMDGFETVKEIRKNDKYKDKPVIALTAYTMLDEKDIIERNGFDDLITKPVDSISMAFKIQRILENKT